MGSWGAGPRGQRGAWVQDRGVSPLREGPGLTELSSLNSPTLRSLPPWAMSSLRRHPCSHGDQPGAHQQGTAPTTQLPSGSPEIRLGKRKWVVPSPRLGTLPSAGCLLCLFSQPPRSLIGRAAPIKGTSGESDNLVPRCHCRRDSAFSLVGSRSLKSQGHLCPSAPAPVPFPVSRQLWPGPSQPRLLTSQGHLHG